MLKKDRLTSTEVEGLADAAALLATRDETAPAEPSADSLADEFSSAEEADEAALAPDAYARPATAKASGAASVATAWH